MHDSLRNLQCSANCSATKLRLVKQANSLPPTPLPLCHLPPSLHHNRCCHCCASCSAFSIFISARHNFNIGSGKAQQECAAAEPEEGKSSCCSLLSLPGRHVVDVVVLLLHVQVPPCGGLCLPESLNLGPCPCPVCHALFLPLLPRYLYLLILICLLHILHYAPLGQACCQCKLISPKTICAQFRLMLLLLLLLLL